MAATNTITPPPPPTGTPTIPSENAPGKYPLKLGSVFFWTGECPEDLPIGGAEQMEETHTIIGGGRVVQTFGPSADDVTWTGKFYDQNMAIRVAQLRLYMTNAVQIFCSYQAEQYYVIIKEFKPNYRGGYGSYSITLVVVKDANGAFTLSNPISIDTQVSALFVQAQSANQAILNTLPPLATLNTNPTLGAGAIASAKAAYAFQQTLTNLQNILATVGPIASNFPVAGPAIEAAANLASFSIGTYQDTLSGTDQNVVNAALLQASVSAIGFNAVRGQSISQTIVQGTSTFRIAAQQYGNVSEAFPLALANNLASPFISAATGITLNLPPLTSQH
jgi:hypothetical protein